MSSDTKNNKARLLPSDLTSKELESLSFVPGSLTNFDEKEKLPPTARPQWAYVQLNPTEYLERFSNELGLLGVSVAICFINKESYEDKSKDLKTPITVNLIVNPNQFEEIKTHLVELGLSHQIMEDNKGFVLPYLGSIQKMLDAFDLPRLISYVFIKNSISREAYYSWISVPKQYLAPKPVKRAEPGNLGPNPASREKDEEASKATDESRLNSKAPVPSAARRKDAPKENFNYVIYDEDEGETKPPITVPVPEPKSVGVIVAANPPTPKASRFSKLGKRFGPKKGKKEKSEGKRLGKSSPTALFDALMFFCLCLFNFYCSIILLTFLASIADAFNSILLEAVTLSAFTAILFAIFVIRPSFRNPRSRMWSLGAYTAFFGAAGYRIFVTYKQPEPTGYLVATAIALICLMGALISAFWRIDRLSLRKSAAVASKTKSEQEADEKAKDDEKETSAAEKPEKSVNKHGRTYLPPPIKPQARKEEAKRIELKKPASNNRSREQKASPKPATTTAGNHKSIPLKSVSEEQKEAIRNRLARKDLNHTAPDSEKVPPAETIENSQGAEKQLSAAEIKAKLAERLKQTRAVNNRLNGSISEMESRQMGSEDTDNEGQPIKLRKPEDRFETASTNQDETEQADNQQSSGQEEKGKFKLSLPKD